MDEVDEYIKNTPEPQRTRLIKIRKLGMDLIPEPEEMISYGVPTFKSNKKIIFYYAGFKNHISIFPASDEMVNVVGSGIGKYRKSKGTLQFKLDEPLPEKLIKKIILYRLSLIK